MEAFRQPLSATLSPGPAERLPFDIVRTLVAARQAATPTAHMLAGRAVPAATERGDPGDALLLMMLGAAGGADTSRAAGARFATCSIGRVAASIQEVSA